jgi:hypothetical protein
MPKNRHRPSSDALYRRYYNLPHDARAKVDEIMARYSPTSNWERTLILAEAIDVVRRGLVCKGRCCGGMTREERLAEM